MEGTRLGRLASIIMLIIILIIIVSAIIVVITVVTVIVVSIMASSTSSSHRRHTCVGASFSPRATKMSRLQWPAGRRPRYRYKAFRFQEGELYAIGGLSKTRPDCEEFANVVLRPLLLLEPREDRALMIKKVIAWR